MEGAELVDELIVAKEFSYVTDRSAGDGWTLVGDAWGFIDPVYSSGVFFAFLDLAMAAYPRAFATYSRHGRACPGHPRLPLLRSKAWMPGTRPGMTVESDARYAGLL